MTGRHSAWRRRGKAVETLVLRFGETTEHARVVPRRENSEKMSTERLLPEAKLEEIYLVPGASCFYMKYVIHVPVRGTPTYRSYSRADSVECQRRRPFRYQETWSGWITDVGTPSTGRPPSWATGESSCSRRLTTAT